MGQSTEVWYPENANVYVYDHVEKETATGTIDGSNKTFTISNAAAPITGLDTNGSVLPQYVDANGSVARRDALVYLRKNGADTIYDTTATGSIVFNASGSTFDFEVAPTSSDADSVVVTYVHTRAEKTEEVITVSESGGDRPVEFITVYGGKKIKVNKTQEPFSVDVEVLKSDLDFAELVMGYVVTESIGGSTVKTTSGGNKRANKALLIDNTDPDTSNQMKLIYWNVSGTSKTIDAPAEEHYTEKITFECKPEDKTEIYSEHA